MNGRETSFPQAGAQLQNRHGPKMESALRVFLLILSDRQYCRRILNHINRRQLSPYLTSRPAANALVHKPVAFERFSEGVQRIARVWMLVDQPPPGVFCGEHTANVVEVGILSVAGQELTKPFPSMPAQGSTEKGSRNGVSREKGENKRSGAPDRRG